MAIKIEQINENSIGQSEIDTSSRERIRFFKWDKESDYFMGIMCICFFPILMIRLKWLNMGKNWIVLRCING